MPRDIRNRRTVCRHKIPKAIFAILEVPTTGGARLRMPIMDISLNDLCFAVPPGSPPFEKGTNLADTLIVVGNFRIECHLGVRRTWRQFDSAVHCGARLYPKSESDQNELVGLIAALDARGSERQTS